MLTLIQIDKSGGDIFEKDYSVVLVVDKEKVYGVNIPQSVKDSLIDNFRKGKLRINHLSEKRRKSRFRLRFHTAVVIKLLEKAIYETKPFEKINIEICNDFDGHFHEIKDMVFKHISKILSAIKPEDIVQAKFQKPSLVDSAGKAFREKDKHKLKDFKTLKLNLEELVDIIRK